MKKYLFGFVFLLTPLALPFLLKAIYPLLSSYKEIGSIDGWLGFLGAYVGGFIALVGIWWQLKKEDRNRKTGVIKYVHYVFKKNLNYEFFDNIPFNVHSTLSQFRGYNGSYSFYYNFNDNFFYDNLKIVMEFDSDLGTELLNLKDNIENFVNYFGKFEALINRRIYLLNELLKKIPTLDNEIHFIFHLGDFSMELNDYLKPIKKENLNINFSESFKKNMEIDLLNTSFNNNFKNKIKKSLNTIFNEQSKNPSEDLFEIIVDCIFEITNKAKIDFDTHELKEINLMTYNLSKKPFKINEQIKEVYDLLNKIIPLPRGTFFYFPYTHLHKNQQYPTIYGFITLPLLSFSLTLRETYSRASKPVDTQVSLLE